MFPQTVVQTCIVHLIRNSLDFVSWKDRKLIVPALKAIYRGKDAEAGRQALDDFEAGPWGTRYPAVVQSWRRNWQHVVPFFAFLESVRRIIYTTNAIEALNSKIRRAVRTRGHFPNDDAARNYCIWFSTTQATDGKLRRVSGSKRGLSSPSSLPTGSRPKMKTAPRTRFLTLPKTGKMLAAQFLRNLTAMLPYRLHTILADNGIQFTNHERHVDASAHIFGRVCRENDIDHRLTKIKHPWTNGQVERMNRSIKEATVHYYHYDSHNQFKRHLADFINAYNFARRLKSLKGPTPYEFICKCWTNQSERFKLNPLIKCRD